MADKVDLEGRVIIVTGAGRGIGRSHAIQMAEAGAKVVVNDLGVNADGTQPRSTPAEEVVADIATAGGEAVVSIDDISDEAGANAMVQTALDTYGRLDGLVNNAGILRSGLLLRTSADDFRKVVDVHLVGTFLTTRAAGTYWREQAKAGSSIDARIVNTSSSAGLYGFLAETAYGAAKAAVASFTQISAAELGHYGVRVNAIAPAALTRLTAWSEGEAAVDLPQPEQISPLVVWLSSAASAGVTGRVFEVGGGRISVPDGWHPGRWEHAETAEEVAEVAPRLLSEQPDPEPVYVPGNPL